MSDLGNGVIRIRPVLFCAPVFWTPKWWDESTHALDRVRPETSLDHKPWAEIEVSLDVPLGEVLALACDAWGIRPGPDMEKYSVPLETQFERFAFVRTERDAGGISEQAGYRWPPTIPIAREDGSMEKVHGTEVTFRELLVASDLGLIVGDVRRPYVHPVPPQGDIPSTVDAVRETVEAIRAAYSSVDEATGFGLESVERTIRLVRWSLPPTRGLLDDLERMIIAGIAIKWARRKARELREKTRSRP